jgi:hypothetical protein
MRGIVKKEKSQKMSKFSDTDRVVKYSPKENEFKVLSLEDNQVLDLTKKFVIEKREVIEEVDCEEFWYVVVPADFLKLSKDKILEKFSSLKNAVLPDGALYACEHVNCCKETGQILWATDELRTAFAKSLSDRMNWRK